MVYVVSATRLPEQNPAEGLFSSRVVDQGQHLVVVEIGLPSSIDQNVLLGCLGPGIDLAHGHLANLNVDEGRACVTLRLHLEATAVELPSGERVFARARVLERAGRQFSTSCEVVDASDRVVARSESIMLEVAEVTGVDRDSPAPVRFVDAGSFRHVLGLRAPQVEGDRRASGFADVAALSNANGVLHGGAQVAMFIIEAAESTGGARVRWATLDFMRSVSIHGEHSVVTDRGLGRTVSWAHGSLVDAAGRTCTRAAISSIFLNVN